MAHSYASLCDDFYINVRLGTQLKLATDRATVVAFFERMQRLYPTLVNFHQDPKRGDCILEEERSHNTYRWLSVESNRVSSGFLNPEEPAAAYKYNRSVLETLPLYLAVSTVDLEYLDVLWGFDFDCKTNHHELVAEALLGESPLGKLMETPNAKAVNFEIAGTVAISDDTRLHARVWVEPRTNAAQVRTGDFPDESLSVYVILRQWSGGRKIPELHDLHAQLIDHGEKFIDDRVINSFLSPIRQAISRRS
jgi:hypothetical protein